MPGDRLGLPGGDRAGSARPAISSMTARAWPATNRGGGVVQRASRSRRRRAARPGAPQARPPTQRPVAGDDHVHLAGAERPGARPRPSSTRCGRASASALSLALAGSPSLRLTTTTGRPAPRPRPRSLVANGNAAPPRPRRPTSPTQRQQRPASAGAGERRRTARGGRPGTGPSATPRSSAGPGASRTVAAGSPVRRGGTGHGRLIERAPESRRARRRATSRTVAASQDGQRTHATQRRPADRSHRRAQVGADAEPVDDGDAPGGVRRAGAPAASCGAASGRAAGWSPPPATIRSSATVPSPSQSGMVRRADHGTTACHQRMST